MENPKSRSLTCWAIESAYQNDGSVIDALRDRSLLIENPEVLNKALQLCVKQKLQLVEQDDAVGASYARQIEIMLIDLGAINNSLAPANTFTNPIKIKENKMPKETTKKTTAKKTAAPKKSATKKTAPKKTAPKKTSPKTKKVVEVVPVKKEKTKNPLISKVVDGAVIMEMPEQTTQPATENAKPRVAFDPETGAVLVQPPEDTE